ncbi:hypothetical protein N9B69_01375 [Amylibacter sp.]|jgi:hypothetical protein|nr:hypothetical protein [Amylibacter sp.]
MKVGMQIRLVGICCLSALSFAGDAAKADAIPPNPFASRMDSVGDITNTANVNPEGAADGAVSPLEGLSVVGIVLSPDVSFVTLRRGEEDIFSVAVGELIENELQLVSVGSLYVSVLRLADEAIFKMEISGAGDE